MPDVRPLGPDELDAVCAVLPVSRLHQGDGEYLVAWIAGEPVGHAHVTTGEPPELQDVFVAPEHRGRGVARAIVEAAAQRCAARGDRCVRLEVSVREPKVAALYESLGFTDAGLPRRRVQGTVELRTGPIEVDDELATYELRLGPPGRSRAPGRP